MYLISRFTANNPAIWLIVLLAIAGAGVATGALNFSKTLGGTIGAALFGAILNAGLRDVAHPTVEQYVTAYNHVLLWAVPVMGISLILALVMHEKPPSEDMIQVAEGKVEVPEY